MPQPAQRGAMVRVDRGVEPCSEVSHYYDSLIGKVIVYALDRERAIEALDEVLSGARLSGVRNNRSLLLHLLRTPEFKTLTHTVQGTQSLLPSPQQVTSATEHAHAIAAALRCTTPQSEWAAGAPWLSTSAPDATLTFAWSTVQHGEAIKSSTSRNDALCRVGLSSGTRQVSLLEGPFVRGAVVTATVSVDGSPAQSVSTYRDANDLWVHTHLGTSVLHCPTIGESRLTSSGAGAHEIRSTIPGKVAAVHVREGEQVEHGSTVLILDSMKMEHPIRATMSGTIASLPVQVGSIVQSGSVLVVMSKE